MSDFTIKEFPGSRLATIDISAVGRQKHHVYALLECDVTDTRLKLRALKSSGSKISFTAWLLKTVSCTIKEHQEAAAYLSGRNSIVIFDDINISVLVEKELGGEKVPMPLVIAKADKKTIEEITSEIEAAKNERISDGSVVLNRRPALAERMYYHLPGFMRRLVWKLMLKNPRHVFGKMGNVSFTSLGMFGQLKGWFIHISVHPLSFGIGSVIKKPAVVNNEIQIRDILNMTVLIDHDVIDGAPMVRFINSLVRNIEKGYML